MSNQINISNYEAYLLDFSEGNLTIDQEIELVNFIERNPKLNIDLSDFNFPKLGKSTEIFEHKGNLKKHITDDEIIAYQEGILTKQEELEMKKVFAENEALKSDLELIKHLKLTPTKVKYHNKNSLKKPLVLPLYKRMVYMSASAAAILILYFSINIKDQTYSPLKFSQRNISKVELEEISPVDLNIKKTKEIVAVPTSYDMKTLVVEEKINKEISDEILEIDNNNLAEKKQQVDSIDVGKIILENNQKSLIASNEQPEPLTKSLTVNNALEKEKKVAKAINTLIAPRKTEYVAYSDSKTSRYSFSIGGVKLTRISKK